MGLASVYAASDIATNKMEINEIVALRACVCIPRHCRRLSARAYMHSLMVNARGEYSKFYLIPFWCRVDERFNGLSSSVCAVRFYASECDCVFCLTPTFVGSYSRVVCCCLVVLLRLVRLTVNARFNRCILSVLSRKFDIDLLFETQNHKIQCMSVPRCNVSPKRFKYYAVQPCPTQILMVCLYKTVNECS